VHWLRLARHGRGGVPVTPMLFRVLVVSAFALGVGIAALVIAVGRESEERPR
jgi:hypothetical protein